ncbi:tRNA (adenosine(37)-N6)-dimethylallyltransferase MiaA [Thioalkalicoccus limnaeus]|uniref:tRNA dimethylallyltransferase n=1 Tax=Thioalkalicoccus limnaeus TaxID=120681 RepID=A0ABV4B9H6_9GAMM
MGPTAARKTDLAVELASRLPCDIVSVDSAMIYRGMDIGTAKPGPAILARAPHRLIDIADPAERYSVARFRSQALAEMAAIAATRRIPLLVGGTMLYFRALQQGLSRLPEADPGVRAGLDQQARLIGWDAMHRRLVALDPVTAARIHPNDPQRIQRALEVQILTGRPMSELLAADRAANVLPYRLLKLVRAPSDRVELHARIAQRFQRMLDAGFVAEVENLLARGDLSPDLPSMRCVGYRQMLKYLAGEYSFGTMVEHSIAATRQLARRQLTWLRAEPACHWLSDEDPVSSAVALIAGSGAVLAE